MKLLSAAPSSSTAPATATTPPSSTTSTAVATATASTTASVGLPARLILGLGCVIDQQGVERQRIRQDKVADGGTTDVYCVQCDRVAVADRHLDRAQGDIHLNVDAEDSAMDDRA